MEHPLIDLSHIWKSYDGDLILDDLSLSGPQRLWKDHNFKDHRWIRKT